MELDIQAGGRYQIARDILANGKQCFLEGDVVVVEKVAEELPGYPGAVFIVKSAITGSCFRLSEADLVGVAATEGVQQEKRIGRVSREIQAGGVVLFHEGQQVEVVGVSTEPSGSVIAVSVRGGDGREYRLRPDAVTVQQGTGMTDAGNDKCDKCGSLLVAAASFCGVCGTHRTSSKPSRGAPLDARSTEAERPECLHVFSRVSDGRIMCTKCGAEAPYRNAPEESLTPMVKCPKCGSEMGDIDLFCRKCKEPNVPLIKKRAYDSNVSKESCRHRFVRFIDGRVCTTCGTVRYSGPAVVRRDPEGNITSISCSKCGALVHEEDEFCHVCSQKLTSGMKAAPQEIPAADVMPGECPYCRAGNPSGSVFCQTCGSELINLGDQVPFRPYSRAGVDSTYMHRPGFGMAGGVDEYRANRLMLANGIVEISTGAVASIILLVSYIELTRAADYIGETLPGAFHYLFLSFIAVGVLMVVAGILAIRNPERFFGLHIGIAAIAVFFGNIFFAGVVEPGTATYSSEVWIAVLLMLSLLGGGIATLVLVTMSNRARLVS